MVQKIRCDSMVPGFTYGVAFYDSKNTIHTAKLISRPSVPVKSMTAHDKYVMEIDGHEVVFFKNNCPPHYLETKRPGISGRLRNVRMTFFDIGANVETVVPAEEKPSNIVMFTKQRGNKNMAVTPNVIILPAPKPNRADFETKGKYDHAMRKWKKSQQVQQMNMAA